LIISKSLVQAIAPGNWQLNLQAIVKRLVETADGSVDPIEGCHHLGVVIAHIDNRSDHGAAHSLSQCPTDVISSQRAHGVGALRPVYEVKSRSDGRVVDRIVIGDELALMDDASLLAIAIATRVTTRIVAGSLCLVLLLDGGYLKHTCSRGQTCGDRCHNPTGHRNLRSG